MRSALPLNSSSSASLQNVFQLGGMAKLGPIDFNQFQLRTIATADAEQFLNFRKKIATETQFTNQYVGQQYPSVLEMQRRFNEAEKERGVLELGAFEGKQLVGFLTLKLASKEHPWVQHLGQFGMMILKAYWGQGLGKKLLAVQEQFARSIGVTRIEGLVRVENERAIGLYKKAGFEIEGLRKRAAKINNKDCDEYFIAKLL